MDPLLKRLLLALRARLRGMLGRTGTRNRTPASLLRQIETAVHEAKIAVARAGADLQRLQQTHEARLSEAAGWGQKAEVALRRGDEAAAREALRHEAYLRGLSPSVEARIAELQARTLSLRTDAAELQRRLDDGRLRLQHVQTREDLVEARERLDHLRLELEGGFGDGRLAALEHELDEWESGVAAREVVAQTVPAARDALHPEIERRLAELRAQAESQPGGAARVQEA